ncbi:fluoride efflux transporter CrcB [Fredinandcohnia sp. QZ13]|uniref:fluoride efflux transporter CrcB n=1 Tax=Fredinandcohnia sp. QZ13 TaxID=3073144 RepID=UPI00285322A3|nr:fluoride efflux transporter CrcB [Fredinandcohnia sp. QZ13]MDR4887265.1 fluoride efflux transporter CrcB [Fredinandcohnia sp. QZ13]
MNVFFVMIGGFLGAICRYLLGELIPVPNDFPMGTLTVNLIGCLCLGWLLTFVATRKNVNPKISLLFGTGFIGSFTTFSTFSVELVHLLEKGNIAIALLYVILSLFVGLFLSFVGYRLAKFRKMGEES